jgi:hypothetical protein
MKRVFTYIVILLLLQSVVFASGVKVYSENNKFGLQDKNGEQITAAQYTKLIRLGSEGWIAQRKGKYGLINSNGEILVPIKYRHVDRLTLKFVKLGNENDFAVYNEFGETIIPAEYSSISMLFGGMFLTKKNYKYGIIDKNGKIVLENVFDDIYMPSAHVMRIQYNGQWYEIEQIKNSDFTLPDDIKTIKENDDFKVTAFIKDPVVASGYSAVTFTDYLVKIISSISPSHEETIDELMLSQGADTVSILIKMTWLPKYPFTFAKKYYYNIRTPNNGPLSNVKYGLKQKMQ